MLIIMIMTTSKRWNYNENDNNHDNDNESITCTKHVLLWWVTAPRSLWWHLFHYNGVIMGAIASQITSLTIVFSTFYSNADQRKHQSSASLPFVRGIHRGPVNSPHKWPVTRKMFPFDDVIMHICHDDMTGRIACPHCQWSSPVKYM